MISDSDPKYPVHSVEKALQIIEYLKICPDTDGASLISISKDLGITKSSVHRILDTLHSYRYVEKSKSSFTKYKLGWNAYRAGIVVPSFHPIEKSDYKKTTDALSEALHCRVGFYVPSDRYSTTVYEAVNGAEFTSGLFHQSQIPLYCSSQGKLFMQNYSENDIVQYFQNTDIYRYTANTILNYIDFLNELKKIKRFGYSIDNMEYSRDCFCISLPVYNYTNEVIAAIGFYDEPGDEARMEYEELPERLLSKIQIVKESCTKLSEYLGYQPL